MKKTPECMQKWSECLLEMIRICKSLLKGSLGIFICYNFIFEKKVICLICDSRFCINIFLYKRNAFFEINRYTMVYATSSRINRKQWIKHFQLSFKTKLLSLYIHTSIYGIQFSNRNNAQFFFVIHVVVYMRGMFAGYTIHK